MILAHLKLTLQSLAKNFFLTMFTMVLFPIVMVHTMSFFNADMYDQKTQDMHIPVRIVDQDQTDVSDLIRQTLQTQELQDVVIFSDEPDYTITIPAGYKQALQENRPAEVAIDGVVDSSSYKAQILAAVIDSIGSAHQTNLRVQNALHDSTLMPGDTLRLQNAMTAVQTQNAVEPIRYEPAVRITAVENFSLQYLQIIFIMYLTSYATVSKQQNETTDLNMRLESVPVSALLLQISEMLAAALQIFLFGIFYILINRVFGWGFTGNMLLYMIALFFASLFVAAFSMAFAAVIPPRFASAAGAVLMIFFMFFGGMIGPASMFQGTPLDVLSTLDVSTILIGPFRDVNLGIFTMHSLLFFVMATLIGIAVTAGVERLKKGVA